MNTIHDKLREVAQARQKITEVETVPRGVAQLAGGENTAMLIWLMEDNQLLYYRIADMTQEVFIKAPADVLVTMLEKHA